MSQESRKPRIFITGHTRGIGKAVFDWYKAKNYFCYGVAKSEGLDIDSDCDAIVEQMANMIAMHLRSLENGSRPGLTQEEIVKYYLDQLGIEDDEEEIKRERKLCIRVIKRLLDKDNVLIRVAQDNQMDIDGSGDSSSSALIMVHPNYVLN